MHGIAYLSVGAMQRYNANFLTAIRLWRTVFLPIKTACNYIAAEQYVFADIEAEMEIEILDTTNDQDKAAKRVYNIISEITSEVMKKMNEKCFTELT